MGRRKRRTTFERQLAGGMLIGRCLAPVVSDSGSSLDRHVRVRSHTDRRRNTAVMSSAASVPLQLCCFTERCEDDPELRILLQVGFALASILLCTLNPSRWAQLMGCRVR